MTSGKPWEPAGPSVAGSVVSRVPVKTDAQAVGPGGVALLAARPPRLQDFTFTFHFHALEKERVTHSSVLAWRIPGTGEPVGLLSMGSHRVGHD